MGDLSPVERNALRQEFEQWLLAYDFTDFDGPKSKTDFIAGGYTNATTVSEILTDVFAHLGHSTFRDRGQGNPETHNTEYTDDFGTDPTSRWSHRGDGASWDSTNNEYDLTIAGGDLTNSGAGTLAVSETWRGFRPTTNEC